MSKWITTFLFILMPMMSFGQMINDFDTELDPSYFGWKALTMLIQHLVIQQ